jgi:tetratricopeptide (TPR) repeat protein
MPGTRSAHPSSGKKLCVACEEPIPVGANICAHCGSSQTPEQASWGKNVLGWVAGITAVIGLITGLSEVVGPVKGWWTHGRQNKTMLATALRQEDVGEYSSAFDTLSEILKNDPANTAALHARLDVTMLWIEDTWAPIHRTDEGAQQERPILERMTPVLEAGLGSAKDYRAADVLAHLAWLNLLKEKMLCESGLIEEHLRRALKMDPANVYANAMLGDWLLETNSSLDEAHAHFATALKSGKVKAFVRGCQLQSMIYNNAPGVRGELIRVVNDMRKNGESLGDGNRSRIHSYFSPTVTDDSEVREAVSAVPPDEAWATYRWVCPSDNAPDSQEARFIQAHIDEVAGKKSEAVQIYQQLAKETGGSPASLAQRVRDALKRLRSQ